MERGFDGICEVESGFFVKFDFMVFCCLWLVKVCVGEKLDEVIYR